MYFDSMSSEYCYILPLAPVSCLKLATRNVKSKYFYISSSKIRLQCRGVWSAREGGPAQVNLQRVRQHSLLASDTSV